MSKGREKAKKISSLLKESWTRVDPSLSLSLVPFTAGQRFRKYGLKEVVLSGIGDKFIPLREAGVLHVRANTGTVKKILCYGYDERVGNTE